MIDKQQMKKIKDFAGPLYAKKDIMHNLSHIERIVKRALGIAKMHDCNKNILEIGGLFHGIIYSHKNKIQSFLRSIKLSNSAIQGTMQAANESQTNANPKTMEGKILHDAHLIEGDKDYLVSKSLITGILREQSLKETVSYLEKNILKYKCILPENKKEYAIRIQAAKRFIKNIKADYRAFKIGVNGIIVNS